MLEGGGGCPSPVTFETGNLSCTNAILYMHTHPWLGVHYLVGWVIGWIQGIEQCTPASAPACALASTSAFIFYRSYRSHLYFERELAVTTMGLIGSAGGLSDN